jgi:threonine aldolase
LTTEIAHLEMDECGSLEALGGMKIELLPHSGGKISPDDIPGKLRETGSVHHTQPGLVSLTQTTELGRRYSIEELQAIGRCCREHELFLHIDGARIANAVAGVLQEDEPEWQGLAGEKLMKRGREILMAMTLDVGVHALSLGGTKNGLMFGEAVILMNGCEKNTDFPFYRKQMAQLASKMRYISAQFGALFSTPLWLLNALHANQMARRLSEGIQRLETNHRDILLGSKGSKMKILHPVEANAVFVTLPKTWGERLQQSHRFYNWEPGSYRLMCSWDTRERDVDGLLEDLEGIIKRSEGEAYSREGQS